MNCLFLIDTKGNLNIKNSDVVERHIRYAKSFDRKCGLRDSEGKIIALGRYESNSDFNSRYLDIINISKSKSLVKYVWQAHRHLSHQKVDSLTLIAGDPWHSTLAALLLRATLKKEIRIESQIHFDFNNLFYSKGFFVSKVIRTLTLMIIGRVDQVRVVDPNTFNLLQSILKRGEAIYLAPSLSNLDPAFRCPSGSGNAKEARLLFVGRLHEERNPADFIKFLRLLDSRNFSFKARIVGDGPLLSKLEHETSDLVARQVLRFTGELNGTKLLEEYCGSDVLISCAKHESYGRAMREALFVGARVLSYETTGSKFLQMEVGSKYVSLFSSDVTTDQLISKIESLIGSQVDSGTKKLLLEGQNNILETLSKRWDNLFNKSV